MGDQYLTGLVNPREANRDVSAAVDRESAFRPGDVILGQTAVGRGDDYRPAPGWPSLAHLDYVQKFSTVTLIAIGLIALVVFGVINPRRTARAVADAAKRRAGVA
jgi:hypothetical protein